MKGKNKSALAAAALSLVLSLGLSGCSKEKEEDVKESGGSVAVQGDADVTKSDESTEDEPYFFGSDETVHDLDPEAMLHMREGKSYFFSSELEDISFYPEETAVKRMGRYIEYKDTYYLSYTCSGISFVMTGDRAEAVMVSNGGAYADNQQGWVGVMINGELTKRIQLSPGEETYTLYEGDELKNAEITIIKLSENQMACTGIKSISCHASRIAPKYRKEGQIEFIGDSITCGYGNEAESPADGFDSAQENGLLTYGYITAENLGLEPVITAISGIGLISDYTGTVGVKEDYLLMPEVYDYSDTNFEMRRGFEELTPWDFGHKSDYIVINLGTNDYSYTGRDEDLHREFEEAYYDFLGQVRAKNPDSIIICTMGIMGAELFDEIEAAAISYKQDTGDGKVFVMKFDYQSEEDGYGGDYHPTAATHRKAAEKLTEFIKNLTG
ncbi:MAG: GDSL-type esterase/lipase family protein [Ruminococcus sp.]|nr:GDSL-type esterase/lipase family protein [Ruminococcus sp.]